MSEDDAGINQNLIEAEDSADADEQVQNDDQGLIGSILNSLDGVLSQYSSPILEGVSLALPSLKYFLDNTLDGFLKGLDNGNVVDALFNLLGSAADATTTNLQEFVVRGLADLLSKGKQIKFYCN